MPRPPSNIVKPSGNTTAKVSFANYNH